MLVASVGCGMASELGLAPALADESAGAIHRPSIRLRNTFCVFAQENPKRS
jgi:hypothetical protein